MKAESIEADRFESGAARDVPDIGAGRSWYAVGVLLVAYIFSIMDRQILTLLVGPIQATLHVSDTLMGVLHGFTFAAFYALMGLPIARIIDRGDRRLIIAIGIALWSLATAAGGLATEYWHLLLARIGVAVGEAVLLPGAVSLIADLFPANRRGRAMSVFGASGPFGSGAGLIAGGLILGIFTLAPPVLPGFGALHPWQATMMALGLPGLVVALCMLFVTEPRNARDPSGSAAPAARVGVSVAAVRQYIGQNRRTMLCLMLGAGFFYTCVYGWSTWVPTYFVREFGWKYSEIGKALGLLLAFVGPVGAIFGGWLGDFWKRRGVAHGYLRVALVASVGLAVSTLGMAATHDPRIALVFVGLLSLFSFFLFGAGPSAIQEVTPAPMRGQCAALYTGLLNLLGAGCGPVAVGALTDYVLRNPAAIGHSIAIVCVVFGAIACVLFRYGFQSYRETLRNAANWRASPVVDTAADTRKPAAVAH
ncbi:MULTISPECIES: MFS transporter [unclassified Caballeronia]|uniref:MFS transporter n=1 Tax=unclassified Caballeronia TaxID=2646786 RepID=UPI002861904D|nr:MULTISPECIES: MFS transporter [unclassified Caballeronia]MDR5749647.1 MFS transporter [Caballeronia sp. LZ024]MDR5843224.1 MFS transporter [Caballeronia sp. LZ031]